MAEPIKKVSKWVLASKSFKLAFKLFSLGIVLVLVVIGFQNFVWNNRDVIGYAVMNPSNVRKLESILDSKTSQAVNDTFNSFPSSVK